MAFPQITRKIIEYSLSTFLRKGLSLVILPLITRVLLPEEYAIYSLLFLFMTFSSLIYQMGLQQSLMTYYHDYDKKITLVSTIYISIIIFSLFFSGLIIVFKNPLAKLIIDTKTIYSELIILSAILIFLDVFSGITNVLLNIRQESRKYSLLAITKNTIFLIMFLLFTLFKRIDLYLIFKILIFAAIISFLQSNFYLFGILKKLKTENNKYFSLSLLKELLHFGLFMIPGTFAMIFLQSIDRYMLKFLSAGYLYDVAIYSAAYKIGMILSLLTAVFDLVFFPYIMKMANSELVKSNLYKIFIFYTIIGTSVGSFIILFSSEFFLLLDSAYSEGGKIVFVGVISVFLRGAFNIFILGFYIQKRSKYLAMMLVLGAFLNVILNYILIPSMGVYGAGIASIIAYLFIVILCFILVEKKFPVGYKIGYLLISLILLSIISYMNYLLNFSISLLIVKFMVVLAAVISLLFHFKKSEKYQYLTKLIFKSR